MPSKEVLQYYGMDHFFGRIWYAIRFLWRFFLDKLIFLTPVKPWRTAMHRWRGIRIGKGVYIGHEVLFDRVFPDLISKFGKNLKIWSAACSTGDEPYSLVMCLSKFIPLSQIRITATDIDKQVMASAKVGLYNEKSIAGVPDEYKRKYFTKIGNSYQISDDIKKCVTFQQHNLLKDKYFENYHLIVCRNVVIYFTEEAKAEIYKKFANSLVKGGMLFIGSTEQIVTYRECGFERATSFFYKKPEK